MYEIFTAMIYSLFNMIADHPVVVFFVFLIVGIGYSIPIFLEMFSGVDYDKSDVCGPRAIIAFAISIPGIFGSVVGYPWMAATPGIVIGFFYVIYLLAKKMRGKTRTRIVGKHFGML